MADADESLLARAHIVAETFRPLLADPVAEQGANLPGRGPAREGDRRAHHRRPARRNRGRRFRRGGRRRPGNGEPRAPPRDPRRPGGDDGCIHPAKHHHPGGTAVRGPPDLDRRHESSERPAPRSPSATLTRRLWQITGIIWGTGIRRAPPHPRGNRRHGAEGHRSPDGDAVGRQGDGGRGSRPARPGPDGRRTRGHGGGDEPDGFAAGEHDRPAGRRQGTAGDAPREPRQRRDRGRPGPDDSHDEPGGGEDPRHLRDDGRGTLLRGSVPEPRGAGVHRRVGEGRLSGAPGYLHRVEPAKPGRPDLRHDGSIPGGGGRRPPLHAPGRHRGAAAFAGQERLRVERLPRTSHAADEHPGVPRGDPGRDSGRNPARPVLRRRGPRERLADRAPHRRPAGALPGRVRPCPAGEGGGVPAELPLPRRRVPPAWPRSGPGKPWKWWRAREPCAPTSGS